MSIIKVIECFSRTKIGGIILFPISLLWNYYEQRGPMLSWYNKVTKNIILGGLPTKGVVDEVQK